MEELLNLSLMRAKKIYSRLKERGVPASFMEEFLNLGLMRANKSYFRLEGGGQYRIL